MTQSVHYAPVRCERAVFESQGLWNYLSVDKVVEFLLVLESSMFIFWAHNSVSHCSSSKIKVACGFAFGNCFV